MANIKVAVRIRPISEREISITGADIVVHTDGNEVSLTNLKVSASKAGDSRKRTRRYGFDYCFNSSSIELEAHATQERVYEKLGRSALDALFSGFNACLVAYGQSASGKTYTMMGPKNDPGLTPRLCEGLFFRIFEEEKKGECYETAVSYLEIYNERVRDLLKPSTNSGGLRVREHPRLGPYVQGLTRHTVSTLGSLMSYVEEGTRARKTASTSQNPTSSRSHALLTVSLTSRSENSGNPATTTNGLERKQHAGNGAGYRGARLHLVDLAGSERAGNSNYGLHRLKEGANINKSLVALGNVISALAERGATGSGPGRRFIPYRDSALTWLLKDALGGNATTIMLATNPKPGFFTAISPASGSYNETAHTLRFAQRAQSVVNRPVVNVDPVARVIRELRAEISRLTSLLAEKGTTSGEEKSLCCCRERHEEADEFSNHAREHVNQGESIVLSEDEKSNETEFTVVDNIPSFVRGSFSSVSNLRRRCNSEESLSSTRLLEENELARSPRRSGSLRSLDSSVEEKADCPEDCNRGKLSSVSYDRVDTLALVDIPTLVAVLIKPDENLSSGSVQIEEISGESILEVPVDDEIVEHGEALGFGGLETLAKDDLELAKVIEPVNGQKKDTGEAEESSASLPKGSKERLIVGKEKTDSTKDKKSSPSLKSSKRFGSSESFESLKRNEGNVLVQRSYTTLQLERSRQSNGANPAAGKAKSTWSPRGSTWTSPRKVDSGEKDSLKKIAPDIERPPESKQQKAKNPLRKQDSDSPKRKISKEYSKEETTTTGPTPRLVRKGSVASEISSRTQTPIQRTNRRAEIVAAVTERLYSTRKPSEEAPGNSSVGEFRSPESTEVKLASTTGMKLQEISRRMLAKRRKTCVETQTDVASTVRVKDTGSITDSTEIETKDAAIMTELRETCNGGIVNDDSKGLPVTRVKEIATLTEKFARTVRCKDVGILTEEHESDEAEGICRSSFGNEDKIPSYVETSTNTIAGPSQRHRCTASQTLEKDVTMDCTKAQKGCNGCHNAHECSYRAPATGADRNVICITLPDMLSITIESPNSLESKIAVTEATGAPTTDETVSSKLKDGETQTENRERSTTTEQSSRKFNYIMLNDLSTVVTTRSAACQSDGKTFRIENIFKDPKSTEKSTDRPSVSELLPDLTEHVLPKSSLKLTNSVGTSFTPETTERSTEIEGLNFFDQRITGQQKDVAGRDLTGFKFFNPTLKRSCRGTDTRSQGSVYSEISFSPLPVSWPGQSPVRMQRDGSKFQTPPILKDASPSIPRQTVAKIEPEELKSPLLVARLISNSSIEMDSTFSDDSLDPDELGTKPGNESASLRLDDTLCPPDVVAHTKKDAYESRVDEDFADDVVEFPRSSVSLDNNASRLHGYESLVLGRKSFVPICQDSGESSRMETPESEEGRNQAKKRVSFSNSKQLDRPQTSDTRKPKPIIKYKLNTFAGVDSGAVSLEDHHLHVKSEDSQSGRCTKAEKLNSSTPLDCSTSENSFRDDISSISGGSETMRSGISYNSDEDSDAQSPARGKREDSEMKRVRFTTLLFNGERGESCTSDSEGCENEVNSDEEENYCCEIKGCDSPHRIFASYLNEASAFVHNMNTINDYVNASRLFLQEQKDPDGDYIEYKGCRISLRDDTDEYLKPEDFTVPVDSYKNCLRGIAKLEDCIERAVRHDKFLLDKYGIRLESATTSYSLVDPGKDSASRRENNPGGEFADPLKNSTFQNPGELRSNDEGLRLVDEENRPKEDQGYVETAIFEHLMDSANSRRRSTCAKPYFRRSTRMSDLSGKSFAPYSRLRKKYRDMGDSPDQETPGDTKGYAASSDRSSPQSSPEAIKETDIRIPQCFLMVPETGKQSPSSSGKEYRNDLGSSSSEAAVGTSSESIDTVASVRNKFRYPGSPRAKLLQLVSERRQIVNRSRNGSPL